MNNKNLMIGGLVLVALAGAYYFYNKNKGSVASSSQIAPTMGGMPKLYDNTDNCEEQYKQYMSKVRLRKEYISPKAQQERKENWIKNNCKLKM